MNFQEFVKDQVFSPALVATALRTTRGEIAHTLGLGQDAFSRVSRIRARKTQTRLRQMLEILHRVSAHTGSDLGSLCLVSRRAIIRLWRYDSRPTGAGRQGR